VPKAHDQTFSKIVHNSGFNMTLQLYEFFPRTT